MKDLSFAENQLKKYGWKKGDGIGKSNQGMNVPIKVSYKFDSTGVGFNLSEQFTTNWWENLYNKTASSIEQLSKQSEEAKQPEQKTKQNSILNRKEYFYSRFTKGSTLIDGKNLLEPKTEEIKEETKVDKLVSKVSDEDLYKLCEGRTAHKGARHGIKMNGKLARIEEQEKLLVEKLMKKIQPKSEPEVESNDLCKKKKKKRKENEPEIEENLKSENSQEEFVIKKKKKSKKNSE